MTSKKTPPPEPPDDVRRVLAEVVGGGDPVRSAAALIYDNKAWTTCAHPDHPLGTAAVRLVLAVHRQFPGLEHYVARQRVWTTAAPTLLDREVVRVGAGKLSSGVPPLADGGCPFPLTVLDAVADEVVSEGVADGFTVVDAPASLEDAFARLHHERAAAERPIAAGLWLDGRLLAVGRSLGERHRVLHAELCLALGWWQHTGERFPAGAEVLTTLSPCRMCAAVIDALADPATVVRYQERDHGRLATGTVLDAASRAVEWAEP